MKIRGETQFAEIPKKSRKRIEKLEYVLPEEPITKKVKVTVLSKMFHKNASQPPKYSVSGIAKRIKGRSSKLLRDRFPQLKEWCPGQFYDEAGAMPVVVIDKAKGKTHKTGYITLHTTFFMG